MDAEVMRSSILLASSSTPVHRTAALGYFEERETPLLKLIFQLLNFVGWDHLSKKIASAAIFLGPPLSGTVAVLSIGKEVIGREELCTAAEVFEMLAGGVLGPTACGR